MSETDITEFMKNCGGRLTDEFPELAASLVLGVSIPPFVPIDFGNADEELKAARNSAACFVATPRTRILISGNDRATFLNNFCTNDILKLQPGHGCEAFITDVKARVLGHVFISLNDEELIVESVPGQAEVLIPHLDRYIITEDVTLTDRSENYFWVYVSGPTSTQNLDAGGISVANLPANQHLRLPDDTLVCRWDWFEQPGYLLSSACEQTSELWERLQDIGIQPAGAAAYHQLRIESGFPWYGADISSENLPQETRRTARAISFTKGCYLGQEPIARIDAMGHVNREMVTIRISDPSWNPDTNVKIISTEDGKEVGFVTSAARTSPDEPYSALAYLRTSHIQGNQSLAIEGDGDRVPVELVFDCET